MNQTEYNEIESIVETILDDYKNNRDIDKMTMHHQPDQEKIYDIMNKLMRIVYPGYYRDRVYKIFNMRHTLSTLIEDVLFNLRKQVGIALRNDPKYRDAEESLVRNASKEITMEFFKRIPKIREYLNTDLLATFDGDPAADSKDEIVLCYPGLYAITIYRIAHELFSLNVPIIPRMMSEHAHNKTGIDIHPGATIGKYFFIDHGTGIVIGSTTEIGEHVKIYQGVTLGALSTSGGQSLHGVKRHPTIEDYVTIYSGASVLGGNSRIGHHSIIGSNVFLTYTINPNTRVSIRNHELTIKNNEHTVRDTEENWGEKI